MWTKVKIRALSHMPYMAVLVWRRQLQSCSIILQPTWSSPIDGSPHRYPIIADEYMLHTQFTNGIDSTMSYISSGQRPIATSLKTTQWWGLKSKWCQDTIYNNRNLLGQGGSSEWRDRACVHIILYGILAVGDEEYRLPSPLPPCSNYNGT